MSNGAYIKNAGLLLLHYLRLLSMTYIYNALSSNWLFTQI